MEIKKKSKEINIFKMAILAVIVMFFLVLSFNFIGQNKVLFSQDILNKSVIYYEGKYTPEDLIVSTNNNKNILYGFSSAEYEIIGLSEDSKLYLTFKLSGLDSLETYTLTVSFELKDNSDALSQMRLGVIEYLPQQNYEEEESTSYTNISFTESESYTDYYTTDDYFTYYTSLDFTANTEGEAWFVIELDNELGEYNFEIRKLKFELETRSNDN